ncbi:patatin-like phospholipase family protein (plasmid) [Microvirga terrae]|uniref:Patatin-like phospholipase family protein n=1 Tax=Microvirga terrae TaxID=2740529 RepID=A0ABY5RZ66_9HYPH|nr:patatin-like phospholipase family protein [Microvirga terrae]UVF22540.1 patatin-like phospholipase family protein [Microvirga terrae]
MDNSCGCEPATGKAGLNRRHIAAVAAGVLGSVIGPSVGLAASRSDLRHVPQRETERTPVSPEAASAAEIAGMSGVRLWADNPDTFLPLVQNLWAQRDVSWLSLSGGGDDGAYGAGVLAGWTASGGRPEFAVVTGVSTGALIAPFAFLGPRYDEVLKRVYTTISAADVFEFGGSAESLLSSWPLSDTIARWITPGLLLEVAAEHRRGRRLFALTTNVDAQRPVLWNMGAIAAHGGPEAVTLFCKVLLASASIPGLFQPVMIDVVGDNRHFQEMHVDGSASAYLFVAPQPMLLDNQAIERLPVDHLYLVVNNTLRPNFALTERITSAVLGRAMSVGTKAFAALELAVIFQISRSQGIDFNLTFVADDFNRPSSGPFDPTYMAALFEHGYTRAASKEAFAKAFAPAPEAVDRDFTGRKRLEFR